MDTNNQMNISHLTSRPNGINVNLKTVISRIHGLKTYVRATPQRREQFKLVMALVHSRNTDLDQSQNRGKSSSSKKQPKSHMKTLILDVKTRWNSTYLMLDCALKLQDAFTMFCHRSEASKYALSLVEWEKVAQLVDFL
jgi:hypothetical protein